MVAEAGQCNNHKLDIREVAEKDDQPLTYIYHLTYFVVVWDSEQRADSKPMIQLAYMKARKSNWGPHD